MRRGWTPLDEIRPSPYWKYHYRDCGHKLVNSRFGVDHRCPYCKAENGTNNSNYTLEFDDKNYLHIVEKDAMAEQLDIEVLPYHTVWQGICVDCGGEVVRWHETPQNTIAKPDILQGWLDQGLRITDRRCWTKCRCPQEKTA